MYKICFKLFVEFKTRFIKQITFNIYNNICNDLFAGFKIHKPIKKLKIIEIINPGREYEISALYIVQIDRQIDY